MRLKKREDSLLFMQMVIDSMTEQVMVISPDYRVRLMNRAARAFSGDDTFCYRMFHGAGSPCEGEKCPCPLQEVLRSRQPVTVTHTHLRQDGTEVFVEVNASPVFDRSGDVSYVLEICRDMTEKVRREQLRRKMDEQLFRQQKEESIATLASGIAHDFNNILMAVLGNAELLKMKLPLKPYEEEPLNNIISSVERMTGLTRQLLAYAKAGKYMLIMVHLQDAIREALNLAGAGRTTTIKTVARADEDLWPVLADKNQIIQALVNLFNNAFEVMEDRGGVLTVTAGNVSQKPRWSCRLHPEHRGGDYVHISIADTGPGISESAALRVFEPFYTTKFMGRGLGLSATHGIVLSHDGCISLESAEGKGTTFHIFLPRAGELPKP
jgi:signal transduction histidine kinase